MLNPSGGVVHMRFGKFFLALLTTAVFGGRALAMPAPDANSALILDATVSGCPGGSEWTKATALGFTPVCVDAATWGGYDHCRIRNLPTVRFR